MPDGIDPKQRPPLPARADRLRLTLLSGCNTITKRAAERLGPCLCVPVCILYPRAQSCPWPERGQTKHARLPQREPGPGSQQRQHLISHAYPEASFSTRAANCSLSSSLPHLLLFCASARHSLCLFRLPPQAPLAIAASPSALTPLAPLPPSITVPSFFVLDQHRPPLSHSGYSRRHIPRQPALHLARLVCAADAWPFDLPVPADL